MSLGVWERKPDTPLSANAAPSLLQNNLSIAWPQRLLAYAHRDETTIVNLDDDSHRSVPFRQKPTKVFEVGKGIMRMLMTHTLAEHKGSESTVFARGIAASQRGQRVCVGCSSGHEEEGTLGAVLVIGLEEPEIDIQLERWVPAHTAAISALAASLVGDDVVCTADDRGEIRLWEFPAFTPRKQCREALALPSTGDSCTTVALPRPELCVAGFASGHIRLYVASSVGCGLVMELQAHTRCVTALCVDPRCEHVATVGEDSYLHVWALTGVASVSEESSSSSGEAKLDSSEAKKTTTGFLPISLARAYSEDVEDALLTGVHFVVQGNSFDIAATAYDQESIKRWRVLVIPLQGRRR